MYDLIIIGGGPAACSAAVYAARKRLKTLVVAGEFAGQSTVSADIQNWIGTPHISGADLSKNLKAHVMEYKGEFLDVREGVWVNSISDTANDFTVSINDNKESFKGRTVLIASGSKRRPLTIKGADIYENKGLTYCATCDGPLFADQDTIVVGGGNSAFETAAQLLAYCKSVTLVNRGTDFKADEITVSSTKKDPKFTALTGVEMIEVTGGDFVDGMMIKLSDGTEKKIPATGIFVEIGQIPSAQFAKDIVAQNEVGSIKIDPRTQATSTPGIWSAGDVTDVLYHQNNIASGDAVRALEDIYIWLHKNNA